MATHGEPSVVAVTVTGGKIVEIAVFADPERIRQLDLAPLLTDASDRVDR